MKKTILLIAILFISGCTIQYDMTINENLSVDEKVFLTEEKSKFLNVITKSDFFDENDTTSNIYYFLDSFVDTIATNDDYLLYLEKSDMKLTDNDNKMNLQYDMYYNNFYEYQNSELIYKLLEFFEVKEKKNKKYELKMSGLFYNYINEYLNYENISFENNEIYFNINIPFKVMSSNADIQKEGKYTWIINRNNTDREINILFDSKALIKNEKLNRILFTIIFVIIFGVLIFIYNAVKKSKKVNEIK